MTLMSRRIPFVGLVAGLPCPTRSVRDTARQAAPYLRKRVNKSRQHSGLTNAPSINWGRIAESSYLLGRARTCRAHLLCSAAGSRGARCSLALPSARLAGYEAHGTGSSAQRTYVKRADLHLYARRP